MSDPRIRDLIQHAVDDNAVEVKNTFDELMLDRIRDIIDQRKIEVAQNFIQSADDSDDLANEIEDEMEADAENNEE